MYIVLFRNIIYFLFEIDVKLKNDNWVTCRQVEENNIVNQKALI